MKVTPKNSAEWAEYTDSVAANFQEELASGRFNSNLTGYIAASREETMNQVKEQVQMGLAEALQTDKKNAPPVDLSTGSPRIKGAKQKNTVYNQAASGAKANGIFGDTAEYVRAVASEGGRANYKDRKDLNAKLEKVRDIQNSFGSETPDAGGFLIPEEFRADLLMLSLESSVVRPRATVIPMTTLRQYIPMVDDTSHVSNVFGGVQFYWTEEANPGTESQATFGKVALDVKKLMGYFEVPNELLADAPGFTAFFDQRVPQALAWAEDVAFFTGTGAGEPMGFISNPATITVNARAGQSAGTLVWENLVDMYSRMLPQALSGAAWIVSPGTLPQLYTMALSVGTGGGPVMLGSGMGGLGNSGANTPPMTILGLPLIISEKAPDLGTAGCVSLVNLDYYLIGDRQMMDLQVSDQFKFSTDKTAFRLIERVDGRPWIQSALTPHNGSSNTLSPFVQIAAI